MFGFNHKKKKTFGSEDMVKPMVANHISGACSGPFQVFAKWLQNTTATMSVRGRWIMLLLFCMCSVGYTFHLLTITFSGKRVLSFSVAALTKPAHIVSPGNYNFNDSPFITSEEHQRIHRFKSYMDSLARSPPGRKAYDSILLKRPGLMDSILFIENRYHLRK